MAQNMLCAALRKPRALSLQLPLFLVPSYAAVSSRSYANHVDLPKLRPDGKPRSSYPRHPKPNYDANDAHGFAAKKAKKREKAEALQRKLAVEAQEFAQKHPKPDYGERGPDPSASRKYLKADFLLNTRHKSRNTNKKRGVSVIRSTNPRKRIGNETYPLPVPIIDPARRREFPGNPNHGLWEFFYEKKAMQTPDEMNKHGRSWTYAELTLKSFNDLHALYWVCHKEANRIVTNVRERKRMHAGYGDFEDEQRADTIKETCQRIREVLVDRYDSTHEAIVIASGRTPLAEIDLDGESEHLEGVNEYSEQDLPLLEEGFMEEKSPAQNSQPATRF